MKKLLTILCAAILTLSVSAQAQFGAVAGLNISNVTSSEDDLELDSRIGMHFGGVASFPLGDAIQLRTGAIYSQKGAALDFGDETLTLALDYLEIPVDVAYKIGDVFSISAGPYFAFLMSSKMKMDGESEDMEDVSGMDMGLNVGLNFNLSNFIISTRYGMGFMNLDDDSDSDETQTNSCIGLSVGYVFGG